MKYQFTLDTNCIIDLEENRPDAIHIKELIVAWKDKQIGLAVVAVSASENQRDGTANRSYAVFEEKLKNVGLAGISELEPPAIWDVFYWDHALWSSDETEKLISQIREILFPGTQDTPPKDIEENSIWRNHLCDTLVAWACVHHKWEFLVTRDKNFHDHSNELKKLGITVLSPQDAVQYL